MRYQRSERCVLNDMYIVHKVIWVKFCETVVETVIEAVIETVLENVLISAITAALSRTFSTTVSITLSSMSLRTQRSERGYTYFKLLVKRFQARWLCLRYQL